MTNLSTIAVHRELWRALAEPFGLRAPRVTIRPRLARRADYPSGSHAAGHIALFPCPGCREPFLVRVYLHELFHAWLSHADPRLYVSWDHCHVAERFAEEAFALLGGSRRRGGKCGAFRLHRRVRDRAAGPYARYVTRLAARRGAAIRRWRPRARPR